MTLLNIIINLAVALLVLERGEPRDTSHCHQWQGKLSVVRWAGNVRMVRKYIRKDHLIMLHPESENVAHEQHGGATRSPVRSLEAQWRYLGERSAADAAYCLRFGVAQAPEPEVMPSSVWSYAMPASTPKR